MKAMLLKHGSFSFLPIILLLSFLGVALVLYYSLNYSLYILYAMELLAPFFLSELKCSLIFIVCENKVLPRTFLLAPLFHIIKKVKLQLHTTSEASPSLLGNFELEISCYFISSFRVILQKYSFYWRAELVKEL